MIIKISDKNLCLSQIFISRRAMLLGATGLLVFTYFALLSTVSFANDENQWVKAETCGNWAPGENDREYWSWRLCRYYLARRQEGNEGIFRILKKIASDSSSILYVQGWKPDGSGACPSGYTGEYPTCIVASSGQGLNLGSNNCNLTQNPINIATGNKYFQEDDYVGLSLKLIRYYNSFIGNWRFTYQQSLNISQDSVIAERYDGQAIYFSNKGMAFKAPSHREEKLIFDGTRYVLTLANDMREVYNLDGLLESIVPSRGRPTILNYNNNTIDIVNGVNKITLTTNDDGVITQAVLPDNEIITYQYVIVQNRQLLSSVTYPTGNSRSYFYEHAQYPTLITGVENENGYRISSVQYDANKRAIISEKGPIDSGVDRAEVHALLPSQDFPDVSSSGCRVVDNRFSPAVLSECDIFSYSDEDEYPLSTESIFQSTVTNALGKEAAYQFQNINGEYKITQIEGHPSANCVGANKAYTYDANGFMASKTDWQGNVTTYIHNDRGQELSRTEASGTPQARTITTEWHSEFNLPIRIIEPERETVMAYDANGRLIFREVK